tara:strand:+ start:186 stop:371 length:186 start_codon:yes stop_codon:yes gene_type:complete
MYINKNNRAVSAAHLKQNKMKGIKRNIIAQLVKLNIRPIKTIILPTGVICEHYANGHVKVV